MPPDTKKTAGWKLGLAYTAFGLFAFVFFLYLTFPYDAFRDRLVTEAARAGWTVSIADVGPGLMGLTATRVRVMKSGPPPPPAVEGAPAAIVPELVIPRARFGPSFVPLGLAFELETFGGEVTGAVGGVGNGSLQLELDGLDPTKGDFKSTTGIDAEGKLNGKLMLTLPLAENSPVRDYDLSKADGRLDLDLKAFTIKGGSLTVPMGGSPVPIDLPRATLGDLDLKVKFEKGLGTVETFTGSGPDLAVKGGGTLKLGKKPEYSEANLELKLKADPEFVKRLGIIGSGLSMLPPDRQDPTYRSAKITGFLTRPNFAPGPR